MRCLLLCSHCLASYVFHVCDCLLSAWWINCFDLCCSKRTCWHGWIVAPTRSRHQHQSEFCSWLITSTLSWRVCVWIVLNGLKFIFFLKGKTALMIACRRQDISIAVLLIAAGAEVHIIYSNFPHHNSTQSTIFWCGVMDRVVRKQWECWKEKKTKSCCEMPWMSTTTVLLSSNLYNIFGEADSTRSYDMTVAFVSRC